jgi:rhodanese-related sulfurtransferase
VFGLFFRKSIPGVTVHQLREMALSGRTLYVLDVRTEEEFLAERISLVSDNISHDCISSNWARLPKDASTEIYTFCRAGRRSLLAAHYLKSIGYQRVYNVEGGIIAWKSAGFETISGPKK